MRHYLEKGEKISLACWAKIKADGKLELVGFDTETEEMYIEGGRIVKQDENGKFYYDYE